MPTTTNNGWTTPSDSDPFKQGAAAIRTLGNGIDTTVGTSYKGWTAFTPTTTAITLGTGGSVTGYYMRHGKTVFFRTFVILGTGGTVGSNPKIGLPSTTKNTTYNSPPFNGWFVKSGVAFYHTLPYADTNTSVINFTSLLTSGAYGTYGNVTATIPFTWAANDQIMVQGFYEEA